MFSLGELLAQDDQVADIHETSEVLVVLLRLLHYPPQPPALLPPPVDSEEAQMSSRRVGNAYDSSTLIPFPILLVLLGLADKYAISDSITNTLHAHLLAHAPAYPIQVYGYAWSHKLERIASKASQYLMPIASYGTEDIRHIPSVEAYHKIVQFQDLRVKELRHLVLSEDIFPHGPYTHHVRSSLGVINFWMLKIPGYGICPSHHKETIALWEAKRVDLACQINSGDIGLLWDDGTGLNPLQ